mgnify:CR=1 FL=1
MTITREQAEDMAHELFDFAQRIGAERKLYQGKLDTIRFVRAASGLGLKEATQVVEKVTTERGPRK